MLLTIGFIGLIRLICPVLPTAFNQQPTLFFFGDMCLLVFFQFITIEAPGNRHAARRRGIQYINPRLTTPSVRICNPHLAVLERRIYNPRPIARPIIIRDCKSRSYLARITNPRGHRMLCALYVFWMPRRRAA